jgi:hypothetical protein
VKPVETKSQAAAPVTVWVPTQKKSELPALSGTPNPVTPAKGATPVAAPALLPEEAAGEVATIAAPVIASPAPAPASPPKDDAPVLPAEDLPVPAAPQ